MPKLNYLHDPMCSWCWAFRPVWNEILSKLPEKIDVIGILGGLAPDNSAPMPIEMQAKIQSIWRTIETRVPGTEFNFDFWRLCRPRRSTYAACRAVIAARNQGAQCEWAMVFAIQNAYYLQARNPSDDATLIDLAVSLELEQGRFVDELNSIETQRELDRQIEFARLVGVTGFPSLVLENDGRYTSIPLDYTDPALTLDQLR